MKRALDETGRRAARQLEYNAEHGITPQTIKSAIKDVLSSVYEADYFTVALPEAKDASGADFVDPEAIPKLIARVEHEMRQAAAKLEFERAAELRDQLTRLRSLKPGELLDARELRLASVAKGERVVRRGSGSGAPGDRPRGGGRPLPRPPKRNFGS